MKTMKRSLALKSKEESDAGDPRRVYPEVKHGCPVLGLQTRPRSSTPNPVSGGKFPEERAMQVKPSGGTNPSLRGGGADEQPELETPSLPHLTRTSATPAGIIRHMESHDSLWSFESVPSEAALRADRK